MGGSAEKLGKNSLRVLSFGLADALYFQPKANAEAQAAAQREANRQAEIQQKREAGMAPTATNQGDTITDTLRKKSAIRRSILTGTSKTAQKLGD